MNVTEQTIINQRNTSIDVFRGLCMVLVVLGHSIGNIYAPLNRFILSFHMPAFFFISGVVLSMSKTNRPILYGLRHKLSTVGYQYVIFSVLGLLLYWFLLSRMGKSQDVTLASSVVGIINGKNITPGFWFVYDLLILSFVYILLQHFRFRNILVLLVCTMCFLLCKPPETGSLIGAYRIMGGVFSIV